MPSPGNSTIVFFMGFPEKPEKSRKCLSCGSRSRCNRTGAAAYDFMSNADNVPHTHRFRLVCQRRHAPVDFRKLRVGRFVTQIPECCAQRVAPRVLSKYKR